ncbi:MAG: magnesium transporter CorA family protein [Dongiaceae bacterium]
MIRLHTRGGDRCAPPEDLSQPILPADVTWIDLLSPDEVETRYVERVTGLRLPGLAELSEIESSSRLRTIDGALYLSAPILFRSQTAEPRATPVGFILTPERLVTVRFDDLPAFGTFAERAARSDIAHPSSAGAFVGLLEAIVDRMADVLERIGSDLDAASQRIFRVETAVKGQARRPAREGADLREMLRQIGRGGDLASKVRDSLLSLARIVPYVVGLAGPWLPSEVKPRLKTLRQDIASLSDYDNHLTNKVQLLLDATLGLINIEQSNIIKVMTVVSVVGVPPTLVASVYGMNFVDMPELHWAWGYPFGLALILLSAVGPLLWFRLRGWL